MIGLQNCINEKAEICDSYFIFFFGRVFTSLLTDFVFEFTKFRYVCPYIDQAFVANQLLQLCTARTAWSESDHAVRTVHSCNSWRLALLWSDSVIKLVSVLFGKCTTLVVTKC